MRILIVTSNSPKSRQALLLGAQLVRQAGGSVVLLWVSKSQPSQSRLENELNRQRQLLESVSAKLSTKARFGRLEEQVLREVEEDSFDLVIVGERLRPSRWLRYRSGLGARMIAERASCSVLVAKGQARPIRRLLLCDSGAISPSLLDRFTARLAGLLDGGEDITVLHVMSQMSSGPGVRGKQLRADAEELIAERSPEGKLLEHDLDVLEESDLHAQPKVRHGLVVDEILMEARSGDYDLVVIGAHPNEGWRRILLDDLAHRLLVRLNRPVLVVR